MRAQAARALGERAVPIAVEPLVKRLKDGEPSVRLQAVIALGRIGHAEAIPALLPLVAETDIVPGLLGTAGAATDRRLAGRLPGTRLAGPQGSSRHVAGDGASV